MSRICKSRVAFTVIELIVVIAIIASLVAILLPAIQRARLAADRVKCASNLRQLAIAAQNYEAQNGTLPPEYVYLGGATFTTDWWFGQANTDPVSFVTTLDPSQGLLSPYFEGNDTITMCPSLAAPAGFFQYLSANGLPVTGGYGYNESLGGRAVSWYETSQTYLFCDSALLVNFGDGWSMEETDAIEPPVPLVTNGPFGTFQAMTHFRHLPGANMAYLDGHVDTVTPSAVAPDPSWPAGAASFMQANKLGFPSTVNFPYTGQP